MTLPRYPAYKDSGVEWLGEVPEHWRISSLKRLTTRISSGKTPLGGSETYVAEGVLFLRSQNVYDEGLRLDDVVFIAPEVDESMASSRVKPGDILLNITGASIGRTCAVPADFPPANVNQHVCAIRLSFPEIVAFLTWFMKAISVKAQIDLAQTGAAREGLNFAQIGQLQLALPSQQEALGIAAFLDHETAKIDTLIAEQKSLIALLKEKRQAVISHAVTKGLNPDVPMKDSGVEWLGEVPEHWIHYRLAYACTLIVDGTHHSPESLSQGDYLYVTAKNIKESGFDFSDATYVAAEAHKEIYDRCPVRAGDVLYIKDGATAGVAMVNTKIEEFSLLSSVAMLRVAEGLLDSRFLAYQLNSRGFRSDALAKVLGGAMTRFTLDAISRFIVVVPRIEEQLAIVSFLDRETAKLTTLTSEAKNTVALLRERRSALISAAVTGKIDVRDRVSQEAA